MRRACVLLLGLAACAEDLDLGRHVFACATDADCARGTRCEPLAGVCVAPDDLPRCGNGRVEGDEACDVGPGGDARGCTACRVQPFWACTRERGLSSRCTPIRAAAVASGRAHACLITEGAAVVCRGSNLSVRGDAVGQATPPAGAFDQVGAGMEHTCARRTSGEIACWGGDGFPSTPPARVGQATVPANLGPAEALVVGPYATCARTSTTTRCWGREARRLTPPRALDLTRLELADQFACGLDAATAEIRCWGWAGDPGEDRTTPPAGRARAIGLALYFGCAVMDDGRLECWGRPSQRRGDWPPGQDYAAVTCAQRFCCALRTNGAAACWGTDATGTDFTQFVPEDERFVELAAGGPFVCGRQADGAVLCFGDVFE